MASTIIGTHNSAQLGGGGSIFYDTGDAPTGIRLYALRCLTDSVFASITCGDGTDISKLAGVTLPAGTEIYGVSTITALNLTSGLVQGLKEA